jgi:acyl carrier protein
LDELPRALNGKVDRKALPEPGRSRPELDTAFMAPRTPVENQLARIWSDVLSIDEVGIHDNFFDLGGHSLAATRVVSRVIGEFQLELPAQALFNAPTVAEMAGIITQNQVKKLGEQDLAHLLTDLESLSEEEARRLLSEPK